MITTQTYVKTVTTSKLLVATMVALFAGGLAFMAGTMGDTGSLGSPSTSGSNWVCKDSDGGFVLDTQGLLTVQNPATGDYSRSYFDSCADTKTLREWYCPTNSTLSYAVTSTPCSNGTVCSAGACVDPAKPPTTTVALPTFSCFDTDGGKNANKQGAISFINEKTNSTITDSCYSPTAVREQYCDPNTSLGYDSKLILCAPGSTCTNGACVPSTCKTNPTFPECAMQCTETDMGTNPTVAGIVTVYDSTGSRRRVLADFCKNKTTLEENSCVPVADRAVNTGAAVDASWKETSYDCAQQGQQCWTGELGYTELNGTTSSLFTGYCGPRVTINTVGTDKVIVILIDDWILQLDPNADLAAIRAQLDDTDKKTSQLYSDMSRGKLKVNFDVCEIKKGAGGIMPTDASIVDAAIALCDPQVNFKDYNIIAVHPIPDDFGGEAFNFIANTDQGQLGVCGFSPGVKIMTKKISIANDLVPNVFVHEIGHCLGQMLPHASGYDCGFNPYGPLCTIDSYGDTYDIMGDGALLSRAKVFPDFGCVYKEKLGWRGPPQPITAGTYPIGALESTSTPVSQCLTLPVDSSLLFTGKNGKVTGCDKLYLQYRKFRTSTIATYGGLELVCSSQNTPGDPTSVHSYAIDCEPNTTEPNGFFDGGLSQDFAYNLITTSTCHTNLGYDISFTKIDDSSGTVTVTKASPSYACVDADNDGYQVAGSPSGCAMVSQPDCDDNDRSINPGRKNCP